ncbi:acylphosphatase [bacterium]|nr:acylphosphatase [bacterium]
MAFAHILVTGIVQGVSFRWFVQEEAEKSGLSGTVENLPGRSVEIWVEGDRETIERLVKILKVGNGHSRIDSCEIVWSEEKDKFSGFQILFRRL